MNEEFEQLEHEPLLSVCRPITSELKPHGATRLTARRSYRGRTPHARPSILKEQKLPVKTLMLIRPSHRSQAPVPL